MQQMSEVYSCACCSYLITQASCISVCHMSKETSADVSLVFTHSQCGVVFILIHYIW